MAKTFKDEAIAIHTKMKAPTEKQELAIYRRVFKAGRITRKWHGKPISYCSECGGQIHNPSLKECPHCHARLTAESMEFQRRECYYHMELEAKGDVQVTRFFKVERFTQYGKPTSRYVLEVSRIMYAPNGERKVFARGVQGMSWYYDAWSSYSPMQLRKEHECQYGERWDKASLRYNLDIWTYHIKSLTQQWRYKNIPALLDEYDCDTSVLRVIAYPWGEMLRKTGQKQLFDYCVKYYHKLPKGCDKSVNICNRAHYRITDPSMWLDHWKCLHDLKLDTRNRHYVCPDDLVAAHNELLPRWTRFKNERTAVLREAAERAYERRRAAHDAAYAARRADLQRIYEEEQAKAKAMEATYPERMGKLLTLMLTTNNMTIRPLQSVDEFREEGKAMHHCVGTYSQYWTNPNTLILSAKDNEGKRLATIEYNMARHDIVQCRAVCNGVPERDEEIRQLITSHRTDIEKLMAQEVSTTAKPKKKAAGAAVNAA